MARATVDRVGTSYRRFNDWLRGEMKRNEVNQGALAEYLGCDRRTLGCRLNGKIEWSFRDVLNAVEYFDGDLGEIL